MALDLSKTTITGAWNLGCDPEVFLSRFGKKKWHIMGSERLLGKTKPHELVATDGVQVELHPQPTTCRANMSNDLRDAFIRLRTKMAAYKGDKLQVDFSQKVSVTRTELMRLSPEAQQLGCLPSFNAYGLKWKQPTGMPLGRSAAGHIHFGSGTLKDPDQFAKLCDVMIGIPCVLLDRSPDAAARRRLYGKAGEYRLPKHGFEYRTLSNFWLRSYPLMSLVFGIAKTTSSIEATAMNKAFYTKDNYCAHYAVNLRDSILAETDLKKVQKAINTNDFDLAAEVYETICKPVYSKVAGSGGILPTNYRLFDVLVQDGIDKYWPNDNTRILNHWADKPEGHGSGWENWASLNLRPPTEAIKIDPITNKVI